MGKKFLINETIIDCDKESEDKRGNNNFFGGWESALDKVVREGPLMR